MKAVMANWLLAAISIIPLGIVRRLARLLARLLSRTSSSSLINVTHRNIELTQPTLDQDEAKQLALRSIESTLATAFEMPIVWSKDNSWINKKVLSVENESLVIDAVKRQKGVIALCPHIGNWEVFGRKLPEYAATTSLYQPPKIQYLEDIVRKGREMSGAKLVPTNARGLAQLVKALNRGEITGILPDQQPSEGSGLYVPFLGVPAYTMTLIHRLVQKTGCSVLLGYCIREKGGFKIIFKNVDDAIYSADKFESIAALSHAVEQSLEEDIAQYQWAYKRFRKQPDGSNPY